MGHFVLQNTFTCISSLANEIPEKPDSGRCRDALGHSIAFEAEQPAAHLSGSVGRGAVSPPSGGTGACPGGCRWPGKMYRPPLPPTEVCTLLRSGLEAGKLFSIQQDRVSIWKPDLMASACSPVPPPRGHDDPTNDHFHTIQNDCTFFSTSLDLRLLSALCGRSELEGHSWGGITPRGMVLSI